MLYAVYVFMRAGVMRWIQPRKPLPVEASMEPSSGSRKTDITMLCTRHQLRQAWADGRHRRGFPCGQRSDEFRPRQLSIKESQPQSRTFDAMHTTGGDA